MPFGELLDTPQRARWATDVVFDVSIDDLEERPDQVFAFMRTHCPIAYVPALKRVLVTTWEMCAEAGSTDAVGPSVDENNRVYGDPNLMSMTGDAHRCLRRAVSKPFQPRSIRTHQHDTMPAISRRYLDTVQSKGTAELLADVLEPLSSRVIGDLLGMDDVDDATLLRWFHSYAAYLVDHGRHRDVTAAVDDVRTEVRDYLKRRLPQVVTDPDNPAALARMAREGMPDNLFRSVEELEGTVGLLIVGGFQEPAHMIASTLFGLLSHPEQAALVCGEPDRWAARAIEEGLRWIAPFSMAEKLTTDDVVLGGLLIPAGTEMGLVISSANRDPARFDRPDSFDVTRGNQANQAFGYGLHFCLGHAAARSLGRVVLADLFTRLPDLRLHPEHQPQVHGFTVRGVKQLHVQWNTN